MYNITIRQEIDVTVQVNADSEEEAIKLIEEGQGQEVNLYLVDEYISDIALVDENS